MCDPASITAAAAVAQVGMSVVSATSKNAQAAITYDNTQANANRSLAQSYNATQTKQTQEADRAANESFDVVRGMAEAKGKASAAAGEAGVSGVSFATVLSDYEARAGRAKGNIDYNYQTGVQSAQAEADANRERTKAIISSTPQPSALGMWSEIGGAAIKGGLKVYDALKDSDLFSTGTTKSSGKQTYGPEFDL